MRFLQYSALAFLSAIVLIPTEPSFAINPPSGRIFRFRVSVEPATLDWNQGNVPIAIIQNIMRGLFRIDEAGTVQPDLVESFSKEQNERIWIFKIKQNIKWSDGKPLLASHFSDGLRRLLNPNRASPYSNILFKSGKPISIVTIDSHTLKLTLNTPISYLPAILTHWATFPVRQDLIQKWKDHFTNPHHMASLGPFKVSEWRPELRIVLIRNPEAAEKPWLERAEGWIIRDNITATNLYQSNQLDLTIDSQNVEKINIQALRKFFVNDPAQVTLDNKNVNYLVKPFVKNLIVNPLTSIYFDKITYETDIKTEETEE